MKKYILVTILTLFNCAAWAQSDPCYDPEWDWMNEDNWQVYWTDNSFPDGTHYSVDEYPFNVNRMGVDLLNIINNDDLDPENGWVLLKKDFCCENLGVSKPYVVFYNRFRGIIRIMGIQTFGYSISHGLVSLEWANGSGRSSALTTGNEFPLANDKYPEHNDDMLLKQIEEYARDQWWVADFQVTFDEKTNSGQSNHNLYIQIYNVTKSTIHITSTVDLYTKSIEIKGSKSDKSGEETSSEKNWLVKGQKAVENMNLTKWPEHLKEVESTAKNVFDWSYEKWDKNDTWGWLAYASGWTHNNVQDGKFLNILAKGAEAIGEANAALGFVVDVIDMFTGKPSKTSGPQEVKMLPTQTTGTISSEGELTSTRRQGFYIFALPGTKPDDFTYYKCPLGVFNLKESPTIGKRAWIDQDKYQYDFLTSKIYIENGTEDGVPFERYHCTGIGERKDINRVRKLAMPMPAERWKSIKLMENIDLSINSAANLELVSAKIAFQGKINRKSYNPESEDFKKAAYDPFLLLYELVPEDLSTRPLFEGEFDCVNNTVTGNFISVEDIANKEDKWINYIFDKLKNGTYRAIEGGELLKDSTRNPFYKFRTAFVNVEEAKNLAFTVREETEVSIKILAIFKEANDDNAPLMPMTLEFLIDEPASETDPTDSPYPFVRAQLGDVDIYSGSEEYLIIENKQFLAGKFTSGKIETKGNVNIDISEIVSFKANHSITLGPGFTAKVSDFGSFKASIINGTSIINSNFTPMFEIAKYYRDGVAYNAWVPCDCFPEPGSSNKSQQIIEEKVLDEKRVFTCQVYPNPSERILNIEYRSSAKRLSSASIFDLNGKKLSEKQIGSGHHILNISNLNKGIYILKITDGRDTIIKKIVKQ